MLSDDRTDRRLLASARAGDEAAFLALARRHHGGLALLARSFAGPGFPARVIVESWLAVLDDPPHAGPVRLAVFGRLLRRVAGVPPSPECAGEPDPVLAAISRLPPLQRQVMLLRDALRWPPPDVCELLGVDAAEQLRLLHVARAQVCVRLVPTACRRHRRAEPPGVAR